VLHLLAKRIKKLERKLVKDSNSKTATIHNSKLSLKGLKRRVERLEKIVERNQAPTKPSTKSCLRLLLPEAKQWHNIGVLLGVTESKLEQIEADYPGNCQECVREMIKSWLKIVDPKPTWKDLAEAVEVINPVLAKKILKTNKPTNGY